MLTFTQYPLHPGYGFHVNPRTGRVPCDWGHCGRRANVLEMAMADAALVAEIRHYCPRCASLSAEVHREGARMDAAREHVAQCPPLDSHGQEIGR